MSGNTVIDSGVTFVATRRNGRALCLGGFFYHINKSVDERSYWKCRTKGCKATIVTINDIISSTAGYHLHHPNDSRLSIDVGSQGVRPMGVTNVSKNVNHKGLSLIHNQLPNGHKKHKSIDLSTNALPIKKIKTIGNNIKIKTNICDVESVDNNINNNEVIVANDEYSNDVEEEVEEIDNFCDHLNVELEVDETGKVILEAEDVDNNEVSIESTEMTQNMANSCHQIDIKPNNIYITNNYKSIDYFDIEMNNLFEMVGQMGCNSLDIEQISRDWNLWKKRYLELKRVNTKTKQLSNGLTDKDKDNLKLKLEMAINAKQNAERELKKVQNRLKESQNNVSALRSSLKKNFLNTSQNQCIALVNEINDLKRRVSAKVESHQSDINQMKRLLCLDDNDLRAEFDQLAQERDDALKDNFELRQQLIVLKNKVSTYETNCGK